MKRGDKVIGIIVIVLIIIAFGAVSFYKYIYRNQRIAIIKQDGKVIDRIDLSKIKNKTEKIIKTKSGEYNKIIIESNKIKIDDSDCRDKICVKQGWISTGGQTIVCLPHRLIITIEGESEVDDIVK